MNKERTNKLMSRILNHFNRKKDDKQSASLLLENNIYNLDEKIFNDKNKLPIYILDNAWPLGNINIKTNDLLDLIMSADFDYVDEEGKSIMNYYINNYDRLKIENGYINKKTAIVRKMWDSKIFNDEIMDFLLSETRKLFPNNDIDVADIVKQKLGNKKFLETIIKNDLFKKNELRVQLLLDIAESFFDKNNSENLNKKYLENLIYYIISHNNTFQLKKEEILSIFEKFKIEKSLDLVCLMLSLNKDSNLNLSRNEVINLVLEISGIDSYFLKNKQIAHYIGFSDRDYQNLRENTGSLFDIFHIIRLINENQKLHISYDEINSLEKTANEQLKLIKSIKNGIIIKDEKSIKKILETNNKDLINAAYENIDKIIWTQDDLLKFLHKNSLDLTKKSAFSLF